MRGVRITKREAFRFCAGLGGAFSESREQPTRGKDNQEREPALREERERDPRHGEGFGYASDIQDNLNAQPRSDPDTQQRTRRAPRSGGGRTGSCHAPNPEPVKPEQDKTPNESPLLGDGGIDEVARNDRHGSGGSLADASAPQPPGELRTQTLPNLPTAPCWVAEGVEPHGEPPRCVRRDEPHRPPGDPRQSHARHEPACPARGKGEHEHKRQAEDENQPEVADGDNAEERNSPNGTERKSRAQGRKGKPAKRPGEFLRVLRNPDGTKGD